MNEASRARPPKLSISLPSIALCPPASYPVRLPSPARCPHLHPPCVPDSVLPVWGLTRLTALHVDADCTSPPLPAELRQPLLQCLKLHTFFQVGTLLLRMAYGGLQMPPLRKLLSLSTAVDAAAAAVPRAAPRNCAPPSSPPPC